MDHRILLDQIAAQLSASLGEQLVGVYVHGSLAHGDFDWDASDLDLIAIVRGGLNPSLRQGVIEGLLDIEAQFPPRGIELSLVRREFSLRFVYPTPYELHFSNTSRESFLADPRAFCDDAWQVDHDLATHFALIREKGITWRGEEIGAVFGEVPQKLLLDSVWRDLNASMADLDANPAYLVLNLCRTLAYSATGRMLSKGQGAAWAWGELPAMYQDLVRGALERRLDLKSQPEARQTLQAFCRYCRQRLARP